MGGFPPNGMLANKTPKRAKPLRASTASILFEVSDGLNSVFMSQDFQF